MTKKHPRVFMGRPITEPDRSKWTANLPTAKPRDPEHTKAYAKAVRAVPELWAIFLNVKADEWLSEEDRGRLSYFAAKFEDETSLKPDHGEAYSILRKLAEKRIVSLD